MAKKINSEYTKSDSEYINILMGTYNKKNPDVIYTSLSTYITPISENVSEDTIIDFEKDLRKNIKSLLHNDTFCGKNAIIVVDIPVNRMSCGKETFLDIQVYFRPSSENIVKYKNSFKEISEIIYNKYVISIIDFIYASLNNENILMSKSKGKTIYREM
jgi:hypothetical protein